MKNKTVYIVDYAYGFHAATCDVDHVSELRCLATLRAFKKYPGAHIVLSAGMKEATGDCGLLADMMEDFLLPRGIPREAILRNPEGNDTLSETEAAYRIIQGELHEKEEIKIICATSAFHAPRVWSCWFFRFGIAPLTSTTKLRPRRSEYRREIVKIPRDIIRAIMHRVRASL